MMVQEAERERHRRFWEQLDEVKLRHRGHDFRVAPGTATRGSGVAPRYVYESGRLLCDKQLAEDVVREARGRSPGDPCQEATGVVCLAVDEEIDVPAEADRLNQWLQERNTGSARPAVSPNHVVSIAYPVNMCPANEPKPVRPSTPPWPPQAPSGGEGVRVLVVDTGFESPLTGVADWLIGVGGAPNAIYQADDFGLVRQYAGHGTFVAGALRCAAPKATVTVDNMLQSAGAILEYQFGESLMALATDFTSNDTWPDIISLSAGGTSHRSCDLLGLRPFLKVLATEPKAAGTVLVAAAGNDGNDDNLFFPAASARTHPGVISVGALRRNQRGRACFSNYGRSVTVFAPGEHHVNAFLNGHYAYQHQATADCRYQPALYPGCPCQADPDYGTMVHFSGLAQWSGTSFATPLVAGMIARHMSESCELKDARSAADDLLATQAEQIADVDGEVLPVLRLPRDLR